MIARLEQLGPFQFFFTLSCADKRWLENFAHIFELQGDCVKYSMVDGKPQITVNDIDINEHLETVNKHKLVQENILMITRNFDKRIQAFMKHIIMANTSPLQTKYYNYRVESVQF
jgi:hypothetical protein